MVAPEVVPEISNVPVTATAEESVIDPESVRAKTPPLIVVMPL
jgi:hypothetical protein